VPHDFSLRSKVSILNKQLLTAGDFFLQLEKFPQTEHYWLAFSGGVDSLVLLHLMSSLHSQIKCRVTAIHINHGLNEEADEWQKKCTEMSLSMNIPFKAIKVDAKNPQGQSPEAWARAMRYNAFQEILGSGDIVLTAHHRDDQLETLLLQLFRGAGPNGLASMPILKSLGQSYLGRPLLSFDRDQILAYASENKLQWINDNSNDDLKFDRNYLRHEILPALKQRWPGLAKTLSRVISHQSESSQLLSELASEDLKDVIHKGANALNTDNLVLFSEARQKNIIRYWLSENHFLMPSDEKIKHIISDVILSSQEKNPIVNWADCEIRRYRNALFVMHPLEQHDCTKILYWSLQKDIEIELGVLNARPGQGNGIKSSLIKNNEVEIRFRQGGEKIKIKGKSHTQELKKLFQEKGVLPWYRDRLPLVYIDNQLALVPGLFIAAGVSANADEASFEISWQKTIKLLNPALGG